MAIERFGDLHAFDALEDDLGRTLTLDEVIAAEMATIRAPLDEVTGWLARARARAPRLPRARRRPRSAGRVGRVPRADRADPLARGASRPGSPRTTSSWGATAGGRRSPTRPPCEVCGERCKRAAVAGLGPFAYAGDGVLRPLRHARGGAPLRARRASRRGSTRRASPTSRSMTCSISPARSLGRRAVGAEGDAFSVDREADELRNPLARILGEVQDAAGGWCRRRPRGLTAAGLPQG